MPTSPLSLSNPSRVIPEQMPILIVSTAVRLFRSRWVFYMFPMIFMVDSISKGKESLSNIYHSFTAFFTFLRYSGVRRRIYEMVLTKHAFTKTHPQFKELNRPSTQECSKSLGNLATVFTAMLYTAKINKKP